MEIPTQSDSNLFSNKQILDKTRRFKKFKIRSIFRLFRGRHRFQHIKRVALDRLEKTIYDQLDLLTLADTFDYTHIENVSHGVFSWRKQEFLKRRRVKKTIWLNVLEMLTDSKRLASLKMRTDIKEIKSLIKAMFDALRDNFDTRMLEATVNEPMR